MRLRVGTNAGVTDGGREKQGEKSEEGVNSGEGKTEESAGGVTEGGDSLDPLPPRPPAANLAYKHWRGCVRAAVSSKTHHYSNDV